jgi:hypothetical protein
MLWPMTVPSRTLSAAASVVVPCRLQSFDCRSEIVKRSDPKGFKILPKRWISTGHSAGSGGAGGSLAKGFENLTRTGAAFFILAMARLMLRRITRLPTAS